MEEAHRESEKKYRELVQNANSAIIRWRRDGTITFFNEYAQACFGYGTDEVIGKHVNIIVPETESTGKDLTTLALDIADHPERYVNNVNENLCRDGRRVWMVWTNKPVFGQDGHVSEILAVGTDITQQKRAEEALRQREEFANKILSSSLNGLYIYDVKQGKNVFINTQYTALTGYTTEDMEAMEQARFFKLFHPSDGQRVTNHINRIVRGENPVSEIEYRFKTKDGRWIWCISRDSVFTRDEDGAVSQFIGTFLDISERKQSEEALRKARDELELRVRERTSELTAQKEILEKIVNNIPVMLVFYSSAGQVKVLNPEAERLIGLSLEEMQQIDVMKYCYPDPKYRQEIWDYMKAAAPGWKDVTMHVRGGQVLESSWANVRLTDGSYIGIGIDVTDRKRVEEEIKKYVAQLEWMNQELQEFAFVSSHDLQEPLRKIQAFGNLLEYELKDTLTDSSRDYLSRMVSTATRMQQLIKALLAYSRVSIQASPFERVDLKEIAEKVIKDLYVQLDERKPVVEIGDLPSIDADAIQISLLLQNLIANAIRYSKSDQVPKVRISGHEIKRKGSNKMRWLELLVEDNGIGFDMQYLDRIFRPFERLHGRGEYEGTGMGLAICRKIAERHGGKITAQSELGKGATFILTLPMRQTGARKQAKG
jgi:PAS domain S-box-containing protein